MSAADPAQIDAALAPLRARLAAASLVDAVGGGVCPPAAAPSATPATPTTAAAPLPPTDVALLDHDQTIGDALHLLARRRILSAPLVINPATAAADEDGDGAAAAAAAADDDEDKPPSLLGWVGLREVVVALQDHLAAAASRSGKPVPTNMLALMTALHAESPKFLQRPLVTLRDADDSALVFQADEGAPLLDAVRDVLCAPPPSVGGGSMEGDDDEEEEEQEQAGGAAGAAGALPSPSAAAAGAAAATSAGEQDAAAAAAAAAQRRRRRRRCRGAHRLAVFDARGRLTHVVSQLDVVRFLHARCGPELAAASALTLRQLGLHPPRPGNPLVTLQPHTPTLFALERMAREGVNGAAVVGPGGAIVANLSLSDCRCMQGAKDLAALALPVAEFLALSHGTSYLGYSAGARLAGGGGGGGSFSGGAGARTKAGNGGGGGNGGNGGRMMMPPPPARAGGSVGLRSAGSGGLTPPTFFAAAARAAAARHGGGLAADPLSSSPPPASPAFGAGGSPYGGPSGLARMSSGGSAGGGGGPSSSSGVSASAQAAAAAAAREGGAAAAAERRSESPMQTTGEEAAVAEEADHVVRLITASPDASLADVVALLCRHRVHRVYLVEQQQQQQPQGAGAGTTPTAAAAASGGTVPGVGRVTGVVTPTDILELLAGKLPTAAAAS